MKLDKKLFKSIVKECLLEILVEGLYPEEHTISEKRGSLREGLESTGRTMQKRSTPLGRRNTQTPSSLDSPRGSYLDQVSYNKASSPDAQKQEFSKNLAARVTKDPIMSEILADTAASTLQEQRETNNRNPLSAPSRPADQAASIVAATDPSELFGKSSGKWAELAFAPKING